MVQAVVWSDGFRDPEDNARRFELLGDLLKVCGRQGAGALIVPGGFLTAANEAGVDPLAVEVGRRGALLSVAVFGGIDLPGYGSAKRTARKGNRRLPYLGFATAADGRTIGLWRQVSADGASAAALEDNAILGPERIVRANGRNVGVLICGELFNPRLKENLATATPDLILDLGHESMRRVIRSVRRLAADAGSPVGHTHHLAAWSGRQLHWAGPAGEGKSEYADEGQVVERAGLWAAWTLRRIGPG